MRVITGLARGRKLREPRNFDIRPTTDKVKESIFNIIQFDIEGRRALDLFAGTGQLGIEALSRGADSVVFVDESREAVQLIKTNVQLTGLSGAEIENCEAIGFLGRSGRNEFGLIFLDPPYESGACEAALKKIAERDLLAPGGTIVCETLAEKSLPELEAPYEKRREYRYGKIKLTVYGRIFC